MTIDEQIKILERGATIVPEGGLREKLEQTQKENRKLRVKLGVDPSSSDLHIGHAVILRKMRQFQDLGHKVILIIGDFTAMIGDPTGKNKTRPSLSLEETRKNGQTYVEQATRILDSDPQKLEIVHNSEWLEPLNFADVIKLASNYTVARMLERDDFSNRYKTGTAIGVHEFMYPLAQAYDSVAVKADVELGGTDQLFNLLVGRDIQKEYGQNPQITLTTPLLEGFDGAKMSKSLNNYIGITESPESMFKKAMQVDDDMLYRYTELTTDLDLAEMKALIESDIKKAHRIYARELVRIYHDDSAIKHAEERYDYVAKGGIPDDVPVYKLDKNELEDGKIWVCKLFSLTGLTSSNGEARRMIKNRGLRLNGEKIEDDNLQLGFDGEVVLQRGKDKFVKVVI